MEKLEFKVHKTTSLLERNKVSSTRTNRLVEQVLRDNADVIDEQWADRHAKFCYQQGIPKYIGLVEKARKYGKNPKALLACLINKEMQRGQV